MFTKVCLGFIQQGIIKSIALFKVINVNLLVNGIRHNTLYIRCPYWLPSSNIMWKCMLQSTTFRNKLFVHLKAYMMFTHISFWQSLASNYKQFLPFWYYTYLPPSLKRLQAQTHVLINNLTCMFSLKTRINTLVAQAHISVTQNSLNVNHDVFIPVNLGSNYAGLNCHCF